MTFILFTKGHFFKFFCVNVFISVKSRRRRLTSRVPGLRPPRIGGTEATDQLTANSDQLIDASPPLPPPREGHQSQNNIIQR